MTSLLTTMTRTNPGGNEGSPFVIVPWSGLAAGAWPTANQGIWVKFRVSRGRVVTGLRVGVGTASGNAKAGLYSSDGTTMTQMVLSASTAVAGSNSTQDYAFTATTTIAPGLDYFAFLACDNTTATFARTSNNTGGFVTTGAFDLAYTASSVFATPPATKTIAGISGPAAGYVPVIALI